VRAAREVVDDVQQPPVLPIRENLRKDKPLVGEVGLDGLAIALDEER
jgi:hypothetical protein